jgi:hypothetical protein
MEPRNGVPCIIDIEASGFGPYSYPIEVGVALDDGAKYCSLVNPPPEWTHWDDSAEAIHHVSRDILRQYGKPVPQVVAELNRLLAGRTVYSDGWVVDYPWIIRLYAAAREEVRFSISSLEMILSEDQMNLWHQTRDRVQRELDLKRHRASNDALVIQRTWVETREQAAA